MKESILFMAHTFTRWRTTGAIAPSGRSLARAIARAAGQIADGQVLVELGPGTGVTTRELVKRFPNNRIVAVEIIEAFAAQLEKTFPTVTVVRGDASYLDTHLKVLGIAPENVGAVLSGLPLLAFPVEVSRQILAAIRGVLRPGRRYVQFTYSRRAWRRFVVEGFRALPSQRVMLNIPPASVLTFERSADAASTS
ncbi:class I SAM-dependent methyltransferase [Zavarzinella formosa]|uniref:class I SAM-dependent methyltransferase n=1 Tax=Zavarzinella formosa TaxID=360055 RepID=UPI00030A7E6F|nr:rRNA adenine N-6-methyltransferase family protein [Zavarzinella formosa]